MSDTGEMAIDTLAGVLRSMAEFPLDNEGTDISTFQHDAEAWAQHLIMVTAPPGVPELAAPSSTGARRDWQGVRTFVREYCRSSSKHVSEVTGDLRDVIRVFIRNFGEALRADEQTDERIQKEIARLERLVEGSAASELKREVLDVVGTLSRTLSERHEQQRSRMATLGAAVRALDDELEVARRESERDPLTRVFNRKALSAYVERTIEMFRAFRQDMCLIVIDIDHFKPINDTFGHTVGDQVLRQVSDSIAKVFLRRSDFVARFGGDEFVVVLRETSLAHVPPLAERLLSRVREMRIPAGEQQVTVSLSMGLAALEDGDDWRTWFDRADRGLYAAKAAGRDRLAIGEPGHGDQLERPPIQSRQAQ